MGKLSPIIIVSCLLLVSGTAKPESSNIESVKTRSSKTPSVITESTKPNDTLHAYTLWVKDPLIARKIAISFHHAMLESHVEDGYLVMNLSQSEIDDLSKQGFNINHATEWQQKYERLQVELTQARAKHKTNRNAAGIPGFPCYPTVEETYQQANQIALDHPQIAEWIDIGDSWKKANGQGGFDLMLLKLTNKTITGNKPKLFIHSSMHAREYAPAALNLDFAKQLVADYSSKADIRWIIDHHEIHLLFHMNPDGRKIAENAIMQRKNTNQNHCPSGHVGVDLNRNFAFYWNTTPQGSSGAACDETFRGVAAESEPETIAVSNYLRSIYPDVRGPTEQDAAPDDTAGLHIDIHSYSKLVLWPWGHTGRPSPNDQAFVALGNKFAWFNNYSPMQSVGLYPTDGTSDDISYAELGIAAFTFELGSKFFEQCSNYTNEIKPDNIAALIYAAKVTAAPYQLAFGPEISRIEMNGATSSIEVQQGTPVNLKITANALQTLQSTSGKRIGKIEYSIDTPIWQNDATLVELIENDGDLSSAIEMLSGQIATQTLSLGQHIIYFRGYDSSGKVGVPSAAFVTISSTNNSPTPDFNVNCVELICSFDASLSSDSDGTIDAYQWDFNSTTMATGKLVSHTFVDAGDHTVTLTVTDNSGSSASNERIVTVTQQPKTQTRSGGGSLSWLSMVFLGLFFRRLDARKAQQS